MKMSNNEYNEYIRKKQPRSHLFRDMCRAFWVGGLLCVIGQGFLALYGRCGLSETDAASASSVTMVFLGALLTGLGIYDDIARYAGAGTLVPITGFANSMVAPALEFKQEGMILGTSAKMFTIAGPVIVYGTAASVVAGLILCLIH